MELMKNLSVVLNVVLAVVIVILGVRLASRDNSVGENGEECGETPSEADAAGADGFKPLDVMTEFRENPFDFFTGHGLLLCAGNQTQSNAMTIGWGGLGTLWGKPAMTVYVRTGRYTHQFMENNSYFTVMRFKDDRIVDYMGTHSGRDEDKAAALGLTLAFTENGAPYYKEADMVIECRLMSASDFKEEDFRNDLPRQIYKNKDNEGGISTEYIGEVIGAMAK